MPEPINPVNQYNPYPVFSPAIGDSDYASILNTLFNDTYNRIVYLKNKLEELQTQANELTTTVTGQGNSITTLNSKVGQLDYGLEELGNELGGIDFSNCHFIPNSSNHNKALKDLDTQIYSNTIQITNILSQLVTMNSNISSLANKISLTALNGIKGFNFSGTSYVKSGENTEESFYRIDPGVVTNRRINHINFVNNFDLWRQINSVLANNIFYDDLKDSSKIYYNSVLPSSTYDAYDNTRQRFGASTAWSYYSLIIPVVAGVNRIKFKLEASGPVTIYATLSGDYSGAYTILSGQDAWLEIPSGSNLIIKIRGEGNAYLYNFMTLLMQV